MLRQCGPKSNFMCKLLIINRITPLSRFAEPFQNLSNHFKMRWVCLFYDDDPTAWRRENLELTGIVTARSGHWKC